MLLMKSGRYRRQNWNQKIRGESCGCFCFVFGTYLLYSSKSWALSLYCDDPSPRRWSARSLAFARSLISFMWLSRSIKWRSQWVRRISEQKQIATFNLPRDAFEELTSKCSSSIAAMHIEALSRLHFVLTAVLLLSLRILCRQCCFEVESEGFV